MKPSIEERLFNLLCEKCYRKATCMETCDKCDDYLEKEEELWTETK